MITQRRKGAKGVVLGMCFAVAGCSSTTAIRPDQLLILTQAAARNPEHTAEVLGADGRRVRVNGTLDKVEITLGPEGAAKTFQAPLEAEVAGATLVVTDENKKATLPLASMQEVKVTYADKDLMFAGGVVMDIFGGLSLAGGTAASIIAAAAGGSDGGTYIFLIFGLPALTGGTALLIPGIIFTRRGGRMPNYPLRPGPRVDAGLGSVRVSF